jgi:hypothetical protein
MRRAIMDVVPADGEDIARGDGQVHGPGTGASETGTAEATGPGATEDGSATS